MKGKRKRGSLKKTWKTQVEKESKCWFGGGCHKSSKMESGSWRDCCYSRVNPATSVYGD